jgi:hypothetical protein
VSFRPLASGTAWLRKRSMHVPARIPHIGFTPWTIQPLPLLQALRPLWGGASTLAPCPMPPAPCDCSTRPIKVNQAKSRLIKAKKNSSCEFPLGERRTSDAPRCMNMSTHHQSVAQMSANTLRFRQTTSLPIVFYRTSVSFCSTKGLPFDAPHECRIARRNTTRHRSSPSRGQPV